MWQEHDCDMVLVHDDDLERIDGIGKGTVSGQLTVGCKIRLIVAVTRISPTGSDVGSPPAVQHGDI